MTNRLAEKVCITTGTGGGMGREAALTRRSEVDPVFYLTRAAWPRLGSGVPSSKTNASCAGVASPKIPQHFAHPGYIFRRTPAGKPRGRDDGTLTG
jgi:hypothetical protein